MKYKVFEFVSDGKPGFTIKKRFLFFFWERLTYFDIFGIHASFSEDREFLEKYCEDLNSGKRQEIEKEIAKIKKEFDQL
jgi:hypothetical protein